MELAGLTPLTYHLDKLDRLVNVINHSLDCLMGYIINACVHLFVW